jgi:hypothetical protein
MYDEHPRCPLCNYEYPKYIKENSHWKCRCGATFIASRDLTDER